MKTNRSTPVLATSGRQIAVLDRLEREVRSLPHGHRLSPVRNLMAHFSVSQATVQSVLDKLERKGLITRKQGSGIYVQRKQIDRQALVGVLVPDITDPFYGAIVKGVEAVLTAAKIRMILSHSQQAFRKEIELLESLERRVDGAIILPGTQNLYHAEYANFIAGLTHRRKIPLVTANLPIPGVQASFVGLDNFGAFQTLGRGIAQRGLTCNTVFVSTEGGLVGLERLHGFWSGIDAGGGKAHEIRVQHSPPDLSHAEAFGAKISTWLSPKEKTKPMVLVLADPRIRPIVESAVCRAGLRAPDDICLISVAEQGNPPCSLQEWVTLVKPGITLGEHAANMLRATLEDNTEKVSIKLPLEIVVPSSYEGLLEA